MQQRQETAKLLPPPSHTDSASEAFAATNDFLRTEMVARAVALSLDRGWIDVWLRGGNPRFDLHPEGEALLTGILAEAGVLTSDGRIAPRFEAALRYRDLLEARLWFCNLVAIDVAEYFADLLGNIPAFMGQSRVFSLFRYDLALSTGAAEIEATQRWVSYTTALTRHEAPAALGRVDFTGRRRMLDVGGNSGEFARQAVTAWPGLAATVFDLPAVCEIGRRHLRGDPRVSFRPGDLRAEGLPGGHDVISFKSVLHDWPDAEAHDFITKAVAALEPGGQLVIFERGRIDARAGLPYWMVANLVFLPFFRTAEVYRDWLAALGMADIRVEFMELDMPFQLIIARKPG